VKQGIESGGGRREAWFQAKTRRREETAKEREAWFHAKEREAWFHAKTRRKKKQREVRAIACESLLTGSPDLIRKTRSRVVDSGCKAPDWI